MLLLSHSLVPKHAHRFPFDLNLFPSNFEVAAPITLSLSSAVGILADRQGFLGGNAGTVITLMTASLFSNLGIAPHSHKLYDLCWSHLLPASLALTLLNNSRDNDDVVSPRQHPENRLLTRKLFTTTLLSFIIASIGTLLGCIVAALSLVDSSSYTILKGFQMPLEDVVFSAGCLCSSYIGGSFNFFSTARLLSKKLDLHASSHYSSLLTALLSADMILMAVYFGFMDLAASSNLVKACFVNTDMKHKFNRNQAGNSPTRTNIVHVEKNNSTFTKKSKVPLGAALLSGTLSYLLVRLSSSLECFTNIPGVSSFVIALLGSGLSQYLTKLRHALATNTSYSRFHMFRPCLANIGTVSGMLAIVAFHVFFATVGASANLSEALIQGPGAFLFGFIVITIHIFMTLITPLSINKAFPPTTRLKSPWRQFLGFLPFSFEELMVGSNAAIGGPTTAAALGARMNLSNICCSNEIYCNQIRKALIFSGLLCGICGYAIATNIGVSLGLFLMRIKASL